MSEMVRLPKCKKSSAPGTIIGVKVSPLWDGSCCGKRHLAMEGLKVKA